MAYDSEGINVGPAIAILESGFQTLLVLGAGLEVLSRRRPQRNQSFLSPKMASLKEPPFLSLPGEIPAASYLAQENSPPRSNFGG
jgi:hypothetical protein